MDATRWALALLLQLAPRSALQSTVASARVWARQPAWSHPPSVCFSLAGVRRKYIQRRHSHSDWSRQSPWKVLTRHSTLLRNRISTSGLLKRLHAGHMEPMAPDPTEHHRRIFIRIHATTLRIHIFTDQASASSIPIAASVTAGSILSRSSSKTML